MRDNGLPAASGQSSDSARPHAGTKHLYAQKPEMQTMGLVVGGMRCRRCVREVTARLRNVPGVETVMADTGSFVVRLAGTMSVDDVLGSFRALTYRWRSSVRRATPRTADHIDADRYETARGKPLSSGS